MLRRAPVAAIMVLALGVSAPALAAEDVVLRISAQGTAEARPDRVTLTGSLMESGPTETAARAAYAAKAERIRAAVTQAVPTNTTVTIGEPKLRHSPSSTMDEKSVSPANAAATKSAAAFAVHGDVEILITDPGKLETVQKSVADLLTNTSAKPTLLDDRKAHEAAVADAISRARADATLYASSLGFHIVRVRSVSNDGSIDVSNVVKLVQTFSNGGPGPKSVPVFANVRVEYVIAPN